MSARSGKSGASASAAASDTTPRMPAHDRIAATRPVGYASRSSGVMIPRAMYVAGTTHRIRAAMTVDAMATP